MDLRLFLPPVVGCVIGWLTNYVAIKLLFRPHTPRSVMGVKFQGLIPKRRKEIALSIAHAIERELLTSEDLAGVLGGIDWKKELEKTVEEMVDHRFGNETLRSVPVVGLVSENLRYHLKYLLTKEIIKQFDKKKDGLVNKFKERVDVKDLIVTKIDRLDTERFEGLLTEFIARELKHLEYLGGVIGLIIGVVQSGLLYFLM
ncbi:MAG: DUF445 domain-containing protein [Thermodesulfobacteriota bacterium]